MTINRNLLRVRIEGATLLYHQHQTPRIGDQVQVDEYDVPFTVQHTWTDQNGDQMFRVWNENMGGFLQVGLDKVSILNSVGVQRLMLDQIEGPISQASHRISLAIMNVITILQVKPEDATRTQYDKASDHLQWLDNLINENPVVKAVNYFPSLRHTLELWMQAVLDAHFPEVKQEGGDE